MKSFTFPSIKIFYHAIIFYFLLLPLCLFAEPLNIAIAKKEAISYYQNGLYDIELRTVLNSAHRYLQKRIAENVRLKKPKKLAIIFDIDETALSNYPDLVATDFAFVLDQLNKRNALAVAKPILPTRELFQYAKDNNVDIFFVTGRKEILTQATIKNLQNAGYSRWTGLYLKPNNYALASNVPYKASVRKKIADQGYDIVANIGDQNSDLLGGCCEQTFKLPNPFYYIP